MINKKELFRRLIVQVIFIAVVYAIIAALMAAGVIDKYLGNMLTTASIYVIVALGMNLVTGMTGQLVLGHAGFMAVGAYTTAIFLKAGIPMLPSLALGAASSAVVGLVVAFPTLRLRGDYLAIVTLAFGEIIRVAIMNLDTLTGGASGMRNIRGLDLPDGSNEPLIFFLWVSLFMVLVILALVHLLTSSHGRAILSVRDDEIASESMGINVFYTKLYSFVFSTFLAGIAGGLFATHYKFLNPDMFNFLKSMDFLVIVVFGGMGSLTGTVAASFLLVLLQEELRFLKDFRLVIYPLLLIIMMIFRPQGLLGTRELMLSKVTTRQWWKDAFAKRAKGGKSDANS